MLAIITPHSASAAITNSSTDLFPVDGGTLTQEDFEGIVRAVHPVWEANREDWEEVRWGRFTADDAAGMASLYRPSDDSIEQLNGLIDRSGLAAPWGERAPLSEARAAAAGLVPDGYVSPKEFRPGDLVFSASDDEFPSILFMMLAHVLGAWYASNR